MRLLLERRANPNQVATRHPKRPSALHIAALQGHEEIVHTLIAAGANPRAKDWRGRTPAQWALWRANDETAQALQYLGRGDADHDAADRPLRTADEVTYTSVEGMVRTPTRTRGKDGAAPGHQADLAQREQP